MPMPRGRHCWSAREAIARNEKPSEAENGALRADPGQGLAPLRFARGDGGRRQKRVEDLERGWVSSCAAELGIQPRSCSYGFRDRWIRTDTTRLDSESAKKGDKMQRLREGWASISSRSRTKQLDRIYGKGSATLGGGKSPIDRRAAVDSACGRDAEGERRGKNCSLTGFSSAKLFKVRSEKRLEIPRSCCTSGKTTARSGASTASPSEKPDRYLDGVWVRSPRGTEAKSSMTERGFRGFDDYSRQEREKDIEADLGWMGTSRRSPRRELYRAKTADEIVNENDDKHRESSWLQAFQDGQRRRREMYGPRRYSMADYLGKNVHKVADDLSWAANCRAKLKSQVIAGA